METKEPMNHGVALAVETGAVDLLLQVDSGDVVLLYLHFLRHGNVQPSHWNPTRCQLAQGQLVALGLLSPVATFQAPPIQAPPIQVTPIQAPPIQATPIQATPIQAPPVQAIPIQGMHKEETGSPRTGSREENSKDTASPKVEKIESTLPPTYNSADMVVALEKTEFRLLLEEVNKTRGKTSTGQDEKYLYEIYDHLHLPVDVILMVVSFCVQKQKFSQNKRNYDSLKSIKHEAYSWERQGILTVEEAIAYADMLEQLGVQEQEVIKIFRLYKTNFTQKMYQNMKEWNTWGFAMDTYPLAYDACQMGLEKNGSPERFSWGYTHGIFTNWHKAGVHTRAEILAYQEQSSYNGKQSTSSGNSSGGYGKKKQSRGTFAHDTLVASATTPPPPEYAKRIQENYEYRQELLKKLSDTETS